MLFIKWFLSITLLACEFPCVVTLPEICVPFVHARKMYVVCASACGAGVLCVCGCGCVCVCCVDVSACVYACVEQVCSVCGCDSVCMCVWVCVCMCEAGD